MASTTVKPAKRQRQRAAAEAREATRRKEQQRRRLARVLAGVAALAVFAVATVIVTRGAGTGPSTPDAVEFGGAPRAALPAAGEAIPDFSAPALAGDGRVAWADHVGQPLVLAIWAPWCPACQEELPILSKVVEETPGVSMVTIVTAIGSRPGPTPEAYLAEHGLSFPVAVDDRAGTLAEGFGLTSFPSVMFVDSNGTVVRSDVGVIPEDSVRETVTSLT
ncbi:MAG TPA: TlpA disulfide reductase family protein [Actinomycetota bacterium]|nr:TlpA disulfide reductase family protein [Actinomycetota bacterium]